MTNLLRYLFVSQQYHSKFVLRECGNMSVQSARIHILPHLQALSETKLPLFEVAEYAIGNSSYQLLQSCHWLVLYSADGLAL